MFSRRTAWSRAPNELARAVEAARARGQTILDLTISNPTAAGLCHDEEVFRGLGGPEDARYEPHALGMPSARAEVAAHLERRTPGHAAIDPDHLCLCASTSEAYAHLLALLCDPDDVVLVPRPGYPLLEYLARLAGVAVAHYPLLYTGGWHLDLPGLRACVDAHPRARAILTVAPGNPTGNYLDDLEIAALDELCQARGLALVVDEVFFAYPLPGAAPRSPLAAPRRCLTFALDGLSKLAALPQLKLSWIAAAGPAPLVREAMARLELVADTFLSPATPVQRALAALLAAARPLRARISTRLCDNLATLATRCAGASVTPLATRGGWTAILRLPAIGRDDRSWALDLLAETSVLCQPGYLTDLDGVHVTTSLLVDPRAFAEGIDRLVTRVDALASRA
ncbi:MAG: pyridoxal phosphate-dependent aminotransferase [Myxococcales bacterium]|nr:pyridoxal phosphate-dependent aminotransferase [Myxococcales bacterium]